MKCARCILSLLPLLLAVAAWSAAAQVATKDGYETRATREFGGMEQQFGEAAEARFVRAYGHLDRTEFRRLSTEFLTKRENAMRKFLARYSMAADAHHARILLAQTLLYRDAFDEAESLLKMVILTARKPALENRARFNLCRVYRKANPLKARILLREMIESGSGDEARAQACFELASLVNVKSAVAALRQGGALNDGPFQRRCRLQLARMTIRKADRTGPGQPALSFRVKTATGKVLTHEHLENSVYIIYFWSRHAPTADATRTYLGALRQNLSNEGLKIVGVNTDGEAAKIQAAVAKGEYPWVEVGDEWGELTELALRYAPAPAPYCIVIGRDGMIRYEGEISVPESATEFPGTQVWKLVRDALRASKKSTRLS